MIVRSRSRTVVGEGIEFCAVSSSCSLCFRESLSKANCNASSVMETCAFAPVSKSNCNKSSVMKTCAFAPVSKSNCNESSVMKTCAFAPVSKLFATCVFRGKKLLTSCLLR